MQAGIHTNEDGLAMEFISRMNGAGDGPAAREAYREGFTRLRSRLDTKSQPTADEIILRSIGVLPPSRVSI
jgi:hypothetical protein